MGVSRGLTLTQRSVRTAGSARACNDLSTGRTENGSEAGVRRRGGCLLPELVNCAARTGIDFNELWKLCILWWRGAMMLERLYSGEMEGVWSLTVMT
jgi:hypothetical protein